jgi:hypothetical protein
MERLMVLHHPMEATTLPTEPTLPLHHIPMVLMALAGDLAAAEDLAGAGDLAAAEDLAEEDGGR